MVFRAERPHHCDTWLAVFDRGRGQVVWLVGVGGRVVDSSLEVAAVPVEED